MSYKALKYYIEENIARIRLARPPKNEMNIPFFEDFFRVVEEIRQNKNLQGVIIAAEGRHFSSGADIGELLSLFARSESLVPQLIEKNSLAFARLYQLKIPVVSCLKGICYGAGLELALSTHFRVATPKTRLSFPETGFGIMPGLGGLSRMLELLGKGKTLYYVLSGDSIVGEEAMNLGLIDRLVDKDKLEENALEIIKEVAGDSSKLQEMLSGKSLKKITNE